MLVLLALFVAAAPAHAQSPLPGGPSRLDLVRGPLITSSRIMGLGGAFVGVGEGIDGIYRNPAALSNRNERSQSWFDIDFTFDWLIVSSAELDWDGDTRQLSDELEFQAMNLGLVMQFGPFGIGALATLYGWDGPSFAVAHVDVLLGAGWAFADGEVIVGAGATVATLGITTQSIDSPTPTESTDLSGAGGDFGVLWRPRNSTWRFGARLRTQSRMVDTPSPDSDDSATTELVGISPWQIAIGWSSYFSAEPGRRYNPALRAKLREPRDRRYLLISSEIVLIGASRGRSLESLVGDRPTPSGEHLSVALHIGAEGEVMHDLVRARVGAYLEPVRVAGHHDVRPHLTGGLEVHLFDLLFDWKANFAFDVAPGWENVTLGVGLWK